MNTMIFEKEDAWLKLISLLTGELDNGNPNPGNPNIVHRHPKVES